MNSQRIILLLLALIGGSASFPQSAFAQSYFALLRYAGTYDTVEFLADPLVAPELEAIFGEELPLLERRLSVRGPIEYFDGHLVIEGIAPHSGGMDEGILTLDISRGHITAAVLYRNRFIKIYRSREAEVLPEVVRRWIARLIFNQFEWGYGPTMVIELHDDKSIDIHGELD